MGDYFSLTKELRHLDREATTIGLWAWMLSSEAGKYSILIFIYIYKIT